MITAIIIISIALLGYILSIAKDPIWGLMTYSYLYFLNPNPTINWWGEYLPEFRWSLLSVVLLVVSMIVHKGKLSTRKLDFTCYLVFILYIVHVLVTNTIAVDPIESKIYTKIMLTYCVIIVLIVKILRKFKHLRLFLLMVIVLGAALGLQGYLYGNYMDGRLNNIGPADALGANELGVLLCSIVPLTLPYIFLGKKYEKVICLLSLPFIVNGFTLTVSRGAFVSLGFGIFFSFVFVADKKIKKQILVAIICFVSVVYWFSDENFNKRISTLWKSERSNEVALNELSSGRTKVWKYGFEMVSDYPFGAGAGGFRELARFYMPENFLVFHHGAKHGVKAAHNSYLLILVEHGYFGLCIFLLICCSAMFNIFNSKKKIEQIGMRGTFIDLLMIALSTSIVCTLIGGLFGENVYYEFFWWQIAISMVVKSIVANIDKEF